MSFWSELGEYMLGGPWPAPEQADLFGQTVAESSAETIEDDEEDCEA